MSCDFEIVVATRKSEKSFWRTSLIAASIKSFTKKFNIKVNVFYENVCGLSRIYNSVIMMSQARYLVMIHDDVYIDDEAFFDKLVEEHKSFNVLGVAGCLQDVGAVPSWMFAECDLKKKHFTKRNTHVGGRISHGGIWMKSTDFFGPVGVPAFLLDGVFLSIDMNSMISRKNAFDENFDFHFYDLDFCKNLKRQGLNLGISSVNLVHESKGDYFSESWIGSYIKFQEKWGKDTLVNNVN